ncbi:coiled-coil domain-containing protein 127-like [Lineus longissimus]|uniref:coiled-coil domain-containing protein 127-like n=1 Tax=Lineus longissimus TaxID=88925 RepID=UPI002B4DCF08
MGNIIPLPANPVFDQQGAAPVMNIPPDGQMLNDPNNPHSKQMLGVILNGLIPIAGICLFAYTAKRHSDETKALKKDRDYTVAKLVNELEQQKGVGDGGSRRGAAGELLSELEREENIIRLAKLKELRVYDETLEKILDVRCSRFKKKDQRIHLQNILVNNLTKPTGHLQGLDMYRGLDDVFTHDHHFCANSKEQNGKFRQLYVEHWRLKVELQRYKNVVERLKIGLGMSGNESKKG